MLEEQEGMGLTGTYQFAVCADGVNLVDADMNTVKRITEVVHITQYEGAWVGSHCGGNYVQIGVLCPECKKKSPYNDSCEVCWKLWQSSDIREFQ
jgi:predicted amidophosphoribosyltransferase